MRAVKAFIVVPFLLLSAGWAAADDRVIWECRTGNPFSEPLLYLVEYGGKSYVKFSHVRFSAFFQADEQQRAWYWHNDGSGYYRYGITLGIDGTAWYHRFGGSDGADSQAIDYFKCELDG